MIKEDYVSFETAKLLKEKGFDEATYHDYNSNGIRWFESVLRRSNSEGSIACPTLQMAVKWLRKVHNLHCVVDYDFVLGWYCEITSLKETVEYDCVEMRHYYPAKNYGFSSPEEAYETAIKYCLESLISYEFISD